MQRCSHGIYLPKWATDGLNPYCSACGNFGKVLAEKEVVLPRSSGDPLTNVDQANGFGRGCPACGSTIYMRVKELGGDSHRDCSECNTRYKVRMTVHQQAQALLAEMKEQQECAA